MARTPTGQVVERKRKRGRVFALRFRAYGERHYLTLPGGTTRQQAERELRHVLADVERGTWRPAEPEPVVELPKREPTFHEFATDWLRAREPELRPRTVTDYKWALTYHLLPRFAKLRLSQIDIAEVDRYKAAKVGSGKLGAAQINKTLKVLAMILDLAIEYELLDRANPARGRRRRVKQPPPRRAWVEPEQLPSLLAAAGEQLQPVLAILAGGGLRPGEVIALDWRDVNLATGTLHVGTAKTDAGTDRLVDMPGGLTDVLKEVKADRPEARASDPVLVTRTGERQTVPNIDRRIKTAIKVANARLAELEIEPISERVTPHALRRTYASLRAALRDDPVYIAEQIGHTDPAFTFRVYQKAAKRRERMSGAYLREFDRALDWARLGTSGHQEYRGGVAAEFDREVRPEQYHYTSEEQNTRAGSSTVRATDS